MALLGLPPWDLGATWRVEATLSHLVFGAFMVPMGPPMGPKRFTDHKVATDAAFWEFRVVDAPRDRDAEGGVIIDLASLAPRGEPFSDLAYRLVFRRIRAKGKDLVTGLETVHVLLPPEDAGPNAPSGPAAKRLGAIEVDQAPGVPCFSPTKKLGFLFDVPLLSADVLPTVRPEPFRAADGTASQEERSRLPDGVAFRWSAAFPAGPTVRSHQTWKRGRPWYEEFRRESAIVLDDGTEQSTLVARVVLKP